MKHIAIVTGASSGIGREFVRTIPKHGTFDEVWVIARNQERLEELQWDVSIPLKVVAMDLSDPASFVRMQTLLEEQKSDVRLLINAAGFGRFQAVEKCSLEDNLGMIDLNCKALAAMTQIVLPYMQKGAKIVEIASVAAFQPIPYINIYGATKAFVLSYARALNRELKQRKIHVLALCPFWTRSRFFERAIQKDENIIKRFIAMYEPEFIVKSAWTALRFKRDLCIPGWKAKLQVLGVKLLPHSLIMTIWQKQQGYLLRQYHVH